MTATQTSSSPLTDVLKGLKVVDCDSHYTEPPDLWTSRAPAAYKDRVPHLRTVNVGNEARQGSFPIANEHGDASMWFINGDEPFGAVGTTVVDEGGEKAIGKLTLGTFEELNRASWDVTARLEMMDRLGLWAQIVYPNGAGFSSTRMMRIADEGLRYQCIKLYNDAIAEWQADSNGRLFPQALLPFWNQDVLMSEARRCVEDLKLTGFTIADKPELMGVPSYDQPFWEPFWELCNDKRVPLNFHIGASSGFDAFGMAWDSFGPERRLAVGAVLFYMSNAATLANFVYSGILDRYPNLKLVSVESGIGWIPFVMEALEYQLDEMVPTECAHLQRRPTEYFRDHIYACFWFEDFGPRRLIEDIGPNNILFETDFPHPTCLYPKAQEHIADVLQGLDPAVRKRVLQDNAAELYGLPV